MPSIIDTPFLLPPPFHYWSFIVDYYYRQQLWKHRDHRRQIFLCLTFASTVELSAKDKCCHFFFQYRHRHHCKGASKQIAQFTRSRRERFTLESVIVAMLDRAYHHRRFVSQCSRISRCQIDRKMHNWRQIAKKTHNWHLMIYSK